MERTFKRKIDKSLKTFNEKVSNLPSEKDVENSIEVIIDDCVFETFRFCFSNNKEEILATGTKENTDLENLKFRLKERIYKIPANNGHGHQLVKNYRDLRSISSKLTKEDMRKSDLDISERWRNLIFRTLTALCIAGVGLIIGYTSPKLNIPLPAFK